MSERKCIGVITPFVDHYYQRELLESIVKHGNRYGYDVLFFCGSLLEGPSSSHMNSNMIYRLINIDKIDGIISISGSLANYCGDDVFNNFMKSFSTLPTIHISYETEEANYITVDNYNSQKQVIQHIIDEHDYHRYVYISGSSANYEAKERKRAFIDAMEDLNISKEDYLSIEGDFSKESSIKAVELLIDVGFKPDVIICGNDEMVIGVYNGFNAHPDADWTDIAVTGFDDIANATTFTPTFTTVRQPLEEMGKEAVIGLDQLINKGISQLRKSLSGSVIVRESCGCITYEAEYYSRSDNAVYYGEASQGDAYISGINFLIWIKENLVDAAFLKELLGELYVEGQEYKTLGSLIEVLVLELQNSVLKGTFIKRFKQHHSLGLDGNASYLWCYDVLMAIKKYLHKSNVVLPVELYDLFGKIETVRGELMMRKERKNSYEFMVMYYYSSELVNTLSKVASIDEMLKVAIPFLEGFHFNSFYVCLFDAPVVVESFGTFSYPECITMQLGYKNGHLLDEESFRTVDMLPSHMTKASFDDGYVIYPLFFGSTHFGYVVCDLGSTATIMLHMMIDHMNNTLERLRVNREVEEYNRQLADISARDPLTNVYNRRGINEYFEKIINITPDHGLAGIVYGDIDGLKKINDQYGHHEGDELIINIAHILQDAVEGIGSIGRVGGDEFLCILDPNVNQDDLHAFSANVESKVLAHNQCHDKPYEIGITLGTSLCDYTDVKLLEEALKASDQDLYNRKRRLNQ